MDELLRYMIYKGSKIYCIWHAVETSNLPSKYCSLTITLAEIIQLIFLMGRILNKSENQDSNKEWRFRFVELVQIITLALFAV